MGASGDSWRTARAAFAARPEPVLVPVLAAAVVWIVAAAVARIVLAGTLGRTAPSTGAGLSFVAVFVLGQLFWATAVRVAAGPARTALSARVVARIVVLALVLGTAITIGLGLALVPGIVLAFATQHAMTAVAVDGATCRAAVGASLRRVIARPVAHLGFAVRVLLVLVAGALLFGVGIWPATCLVALAHVAWSRSRDPEPVPA